MHRWRPDGSDHDKSSNPKLLLFPRNTGGLKKAFPLTGSKRYVGKLLACGRVVVEVAVGLELQPLLPGVVQPVVDGRGDADLVADGDGVSRCRLEGGGGEWEGVNGCVDGTERRREVKLT